MVIKPGQVTFAGGEASPFLYSRIDLAKYVTFLRTGLNFFVHPHGGASNRGGFRFVKETLDSTKLSRAVDYVFNETQAYSLEFGHNYVRFYTDGAPVLEADKTITGATQANPVVITSAAHGYSNGDDVEISGITGMTELNGKRFTVANVTANTFELSGIDGTSYTAYASGGISEKVYTVTTTYDEEDIMDLKFNSSGDVIYIMHKDYKTQTLTRYAATTWTLEDYEADDGPFMAENIDDTLTITASAVTGSGITLTGSSDIWTSGNVGGLYKLKHYIEGQSQTSNFSSVSNGVSISAYSTWRVITHGTWTGKIQVQKSTDGGSTWTMMREFSSANDYNANTFGTEDAEEPFLVRVACTSYSSGTINADISSDPFYQDGIVRITAFSSTTSVTADVLSDLGATTATNAWSEGAWSTRRGHSSDSVFIQDRLAFTGSPYEPMTIHMTATSNYTSFRRGQTLVDTDGISISLLSRQLNAINGLVSLQSLLAFTSSSEWLVGATDDVYTPTSTYRKPQGYRGSSGLDPIIVGETVIYMQSNGQTLRSFAYSFEKDGYTGVDLRIMSSHLFVGHTIVDMAYQQDNDSIIWLVRDDGVLLSFTIMLEQEIAAFMRHETDGEVKSVCSIPADGFDEVWVTVERDNGIFMERMCERVQSDDVMANTFLDSFVEYDGTATDTFTGLDHLEGQDVIVIGDGIVYPARTVTNGTVTIPEEREHVYIGLQYFADLETMDIAKTDDRGMVKGRPIKVAAVTFSVLNTRGGWIGPDSDNLYEALIPETDDVSTSGPLTSDDLRFPLGAGYENGGRVFYRQKAPLPVTITAIVPEVTP